MKGPSDVGPGFKSIDFRHALMTPPMLDTINEVPRNIMS